MIANIYSGETKLNSSPLSVEVASKLMLQLSRQGMSNIWIEALVEAAEEQPGPDADNASLVHNDDTGMQRDMPE